MKADFFVLFLALLFIIPLGDATRSNNKVGRNSRQQSKSKHESLKKKYEWVVTKRPLSAGDYFSAQEMLPVAKLLFNKVDKNGGGESHGIVSSCKSPAKLADKLFSSIFLVDAQIVRLKLFDIPVLDAFQALAISDPPKVDNITEFIHFVFDNSTGVVVKRQQERDHAVSQFTLLHKVLSKEKKLIAKYKGFHRNKSSMQSNKENMDAGRVLTSPVPPSKGSCRWRYSCDDLQVPFTCHVSKLCLPLDEKLTKSEKDHNTSMKLFRRSLGLHMVDEQVERILEIRYLTIRGSENKIMALEPMESLKEYFDNLRSWQKNTKTTYKIPVHI